MIILLRTCPSRAKESAHSGVCNLFPRYKGDPEANYVASGWLVSNEIVVTAGHCVYDHTDKLGALLTAKIYLGYDGPDTEKRKNVAMRYGKSATMPSEWFISGHPCSDVAFIKLELPFYESAAITYGNTPHRGPRQLGVVGFPGDRDGGHYMYEHFTEVGLRDYRI